LCSAAAMIDDDENFLVDAGGNRVLIGLTLEETLAAEHHRFPRDFAGFSAGREILPTS
jgi:hypothetical protein